MAAIKLFGAMIPVKVDHDRHRDHATSKTKTSSSSSSSSSSDQGMEGDQTKKPDKIIPCPRCKSMETKFCYFNNYNVNQPRHFCKGCHRYWTAGGALRNVPVGAGRRKSRPSLDTPPTVPVCGRRDLQRLRRPLTVHGTGDPSASTSTCSRDEEEENWF